MRVGDRPAAGLQRRHTRVTAQQAPSAQRARGASAEASEHIEILP